MDKYELLEVIGSGSFGMIRKIRRKRDNKVYIIINNKIINDIYIYLLYQKTNYYCKKKFCNV